MTEESHIPASLAKVFYTVLLVFGVCLYLGWGLLFNVWFDLGVYSISVLLIGFGLVGVLLYSHLERQEPESED